MLATIAADGGSVRDWTPKDPFSRRMDTTLRAVRKAGLRITHVTGQQGETDAKGGMTAGEYKRHFMQIADRLRNACVAAPIFVATSTICGGATSDLQVCI